MFIPRICCFYSINLFGYNSLNMLTLLSCLLHVTRKGKSLNSSHYATPIKLRSHRSSGAFFYVRNYLHFCIYLFLFRYFKDRVTTSLFFASEHVQGVAEVS